MAEKLIERNLAACVSLGGDIESHYRWQGNVEVDQEILMLVKTYRDRVDQVLNFLEKHHPYDCPELMVTSVDDASASYEDWVDEQVHHSES